MEKVFIEAERGSAVRNRYDERTQEPLGRKELRAPYPYAYGFLVGTETEDEDALDCYLLSGCSAEAGSAMDCVVEGGFIFREGDEIDVKILARVKDDSISYDLDASRRTIEAFLREVFKEWPSVSLGFGGLFGREEALAIIAERRRARSGS